jgi:hypothetical protein
MLYTSSSLRLMVFRRCEGGCDRSNPESCKFRIAWIASLRSQRRYFLALQKINNLTAQSIGSKNEILTLPN